MDKLKNGKKTLAFLLEKVFCFLRADLVIKCSCGFIEKETHLFGYGRFRSN